MAGRIPGLAMATLAFMTTFSFAAALAREADTRLGVSLVITSAQEGCTVSAPPMVFMQASRNGLRSQSSIVPLCPVSTPYEVDIGPGSTPGSTVNARRMRTTGAGTVLYGLYMDQGLSQAWGEGIAAVRSTANGSQQPMAVYGKVADATVSPASFADVVPVTVTY